MTEFKYTTRLNPKLLFSRLVEMKSYFTASELEDLVKNEGEKFHEDLGFNADLELLHIMENEDLGKCVYKGESYFSLHSLVQREHETYLRASAMSSRYGHFTDFNTVASVVHEVEKRKSEASGGKPWNYRPDQHQAIREVIEGPNLCLIQAYAGTGKTTAAEAMVNVYQKLGYSIYALAPSNKAAEQLAMDCGLEEGKTIDSFLSSNLRGVNERTVIFVDEASMSSFDQCERLIQLAHERGCKLVMQGDKEQLPSVARGRFFANMVEQKIGFVTELSVITRQKEEWDKAATLAAAHGNFDAALNAHTERGRLHVLGNEGEVFNTIAQDHLRDPNPENQKMIVASRNADVDTINMMVRGSLVAEGRLEQGVKVTVKAMKDPDAAKGSEKPTKDIFIAPGDRIIMNDTLRRGGRKVAPNSGIGTVMGMTQDVDNGGWNVKVLLDGKDEPFEFNTNQFKSFQHAYAISIHKSQGATVNSCRYAFSNFISSELAYVAMSRHRETFGLYCTELQVENLADLMSKKIEKVDAKDLDFNSKLAIGYKSRPATFKGLWAGDTDCKLVTSIGEVFTIEPTKAERFTSNGAKIMLIHGKRGDSLLASERDGYVSALAFSSVNEAKQHMMRVHRAQYQRNDFRSPVMAHPTSYEVFGSNLLSTSSIADCLCEAGRFLGKQNSADLADKSKEVSQYMTSKHYVMTPLAQVDKALLDLKRHSLDYKKAVDSSDYMTISVLEDKAISTLMERTAKSVSDIMKSRLTKEEIGVMIEHGVLDRYGTLKNMLSNDLSKTVERKAEFALSM